ncbi:MAG: pyridoxal phosphate-dependent aminotransferase [Candidatus Acidiferrum sp.]
MPLREPDQYLCQPPHLHRMPFTSSHPQNTLDSSSRSSVLCYRPLSEMFSQRTNWKLTPNHYTQALEAIRSSGQKLIDLTVSNPTDCGLQYDSAAILAAFQDPRSLTYEPTAKGLLAARQEVARYYLDDHSETVDPQSLVLTTSTSEAYSYVFRLLCNPHDEVLVPKPSYPLFDFLADLHDVTLIPYLLQYAQGWFIDFDSVIRALTPRTRAILLVHPNNPTGSFVKSDELARLNTLCLQRNLALIVDEVFLDYPLCAKPRKSLVANHDALTFTLSGLSKISALPQMKVAWVATTGPETLVRPALDRLEIIADTYLSLSSPAQWAFPSLLAQRRSLQPQILSRIRQNWSHLKSALASQHPFELFDTEGGWYAVLRVDGDHPDEHLAISLMQNAHVLVHPGHFYDFPSEGHLVVSLLPQQSDFQQGIAALLDHLK